MALAALAVVSGCDSGTAGLPGADGTPGAQVTVTARSLPGVGTALLAAEHIPWQAIIALPILFTAGMTLMDTSDGLFMNLAYGWAFFNPVRKVYYNLAITGLPVAICFFIGGIETLSLVPLELHGVSQTSGFWGFMYNFNINTAGFIIVGMFIVTWAAAMLIWRYGHIEERWTARLQGVSLGAQADAEELMRPDST